MATTIIAEKDLSRDLYEANSGYRKYYGQMNMYKEANEQSSAASYNSAISDAYKTARLQKAELDKVGYDNQGVKTLNEGLNKALFSAYDTYRSKHTSGVIETNQELNEDIEKVNTSLRKQGQELGSNIAQYQEGAFDYLTYLNKAGYLSKGGQFDTYQEYIKWFDTNNPKNTDGQNLNKEGKVVTPMDEAQWRADWAKNQVFKGVFNEDGSLNEDKLKVAIFSELDADGNIVKDEKGQPVLTNDLNLKGIEMLDRLNALPSDEYLSYSSWLAKEDKDLYEWSVQRAMLGRGTNASAAMSQMGADGVYSFMERFGGLSQAETEKLFSGFEIVTERIDKKGAKKGSEVSANNIKALGDATKVMTDLYQYLDLDNAIVTQTMANGDVVNMNLTELISYQFAEALGITYDQAKQVLKTGEYSTIKPDFSKANEVNNASTMASMIGITAAGIAFKASTAAATAGTLAGVAGASSSVPVVGWVVAGVALLAAIGFAIWGGVEEGNAKEELVRNVNAQEGQLRRSFDQFAVQSASVAYELRRQALEQ